MNTSPTLGEGFEVVAPVGDRPMYIDVQYWSTEVESALRRTEATGVVIAPYWEERGRGLSFLADFADQVRHLTVASERVHGLAVVSRLERLESVSLQCPVDDIDFSRLSDLRFCDLEHPASLGNVALCGSIERLILARVRIGDLRQLAPLRRLRRLFISTMPRLRSLAGVEGLPIENLRVEFVPRLESIAAVTTLADLGSLELEGKSAVTDATRIGEVRGLQTLKLHHLPQCRSIDFIAALAELRELLLGGLDTAGVTSIAPIARLNALRVLTIGDCRGCSDLEELGSLRALEVLSIERGPELPSLRFLRGLSQLRDLDLCKTPVADGDLGVLVELPSLEEIHSPTPWRKNYKPPLQALESAIAIRTRQRIKGRT